MLVSFVQTWNFFWWMAFDWPLTSRKQGNLEWNEPTSLRVQMLPQVKGALRTVCWKVLLANHSSDLYASAISFSKPHSKRSLYHNRFINIRHCDIIAGTVIVVHIYDPETSGDRDSCGTPLKIPDCGYNFLKLRQYFNQEWSNLSLIQLTNWDSLIVSI